jgi:RNA polymerase sigma-70 factor (subfamily 1)
MPTSADACNEVMKEYRAYLETLTFIQVDPRLRSEFSMSDVIQETLLKAWNNLEQIEMLDADARKRWLRKVLVNSLLDKIKYVRAQIRDVRRNHSLDAAAEESSCRLQDWLATEDTSPSERLMRQDDALILLEALSKLDPRQCEAITLQKYHGWTLAQIAEHLGCTISAVAGLHARGLKELRKLLPEMGISHA